MTTKSQTKSSPYSWLLLGVFILIACYLTVQFALWVTIPVNSAKVNHEKETWVSLRDQKPVPLESGVHITETEDGQLLIFGYNQFRELITRPTEYKVKVQEKTFTKSNGEKIPFWVANKIRNK